ncbi:hypothetical protein [Nonlabens dokdonensis]|uniref:hypothetical protein n=1 Tax=Nonlabens dokdonensis TaxID=328515 RepID=UPI0026EAEA92|nr:hypothetical protein [Nonlabens dokdonensis]
MSWICVPLSLRISLSRKRNLKEVYAVLDTVRKRNKNHLYIEITTSSKRTTFSDRGRRTDVDLK